MCVLSCDANSMIAPMSLRIPYLLKDALQVISVDQCGAQLICGAQCVCCVEHSSSVEHSVCVV